MTHADAEDAATAQEVLRQAQAVISAQVDVSKAVDAKLTSILQASLNLAVASLGAAAVSQAQGTWLPPWAGLGLAAMGACFGTAAFLAFLGLRGSNLGAPAIAPGALLGRGVHLLPARQAYLAIAYDLQKVVDYNAAAAERAARRVNRALYSAVAAPVLGSAVASSAAVIAPGSAVLGWLVLGGAVAVFLLAQGLFGAR